MDIDQIRKAAKQVEEQVRRVRRTIHANPELSFNEYETSAFIAGELTAAGIPFTKIAGTGLLAKIEGKSDLKKAVVLRADMDALPIAEEAEVKFASRNPGVMHACGHDIHTASLLGTLLVLNRYQSEFKGTVLGLFQPGEELCPGGASIVLAEHPFDNYDIQAIIGQHVAPELTVGQVGLKAGQYMASSDEVRITVKGSGGHAAMPHLLKDPVVAAAALITVLQQVVSRDGDSNIPTVLSIGKVIADGATNVIPSNVYMEGTLRTFDESWRARAKERIHEIAEGVCAAYDVTADIKITDGYPCVVNNLNLVNEARKLFIDLWGRKNVFELDRRMTAEDFGFYTQQYPGLFYRLGVSSADGPTCSGLHTSTFNPDENALLYGVTTMATLAFASLEK